MGGDDETFLCVCVTCTKREREVSCVFDYEIYVVTKIGHKETLQNSNTPLRANWSFSVNACR